MFVCRDFHVKLEMVRDVCHDFHVKLEMVGDVCRDFHVKLFNPRGYLFTVIKL
jgi:hypothetical protein